MLLRGMWKCTSCYVYEIIFRHDIPKITISFSSVWCLFSRFESSDTFGFHILIPMLRDWMDKQATAIPLMTIEPSSTTSAAIGPKLSGLSQWLATRLFLPWFPVQTNQRKPDTLSKLSMWDTVLLVSLPPSSPCQVSNPSISENFFHYRTFPLPYLSLNFCQSQEMVAPLL